MMSLTFAAPFLAAAMTASPPPPADLEAQTNAWHEKRLKNLTSDDGWLTLVGLQWLEEGDQPLQLPAPAPQPSGTVTRHGDQVSFAPAPGVQATLGGQPFKGGPIPTDEGPKAVLQVGRLHFYAIKRGERLGIRMKDPEAEARKKFHGIPRYPVSAAYRVEARWEPLAAPKKIPVPTVLGTVDEMTAPGVAVFTLQGKELRLMPVIEEGEDQLFFIFADETNKTDTYGAGRFLYARMPQDGKVVLDFNRAYNPPCAFSHFATCPLPPRENRLPTRVEAGEKRAGDH
ncbi:MAG TPA: DUF1684 domain-containing protein [Myxococcaceae bacterium]|nr:DUF1684 domain-containing protein [Myxococcaceae bacterium]